MRRILERYKGFPRRVKLFYVLNNVFSMKHLKGNKAIFKMAGLQQPVWAPLRHSRLKQIDPERLKPDQPVKRPEFLTDEMIKTWHEDGVLILPGFFKDFVAPLNNELNFLQRSGQVGFNFTQNKILFANRVSSLIRSIERDQALLNILSYLLGRQAIPFQTINFIKGSEQRAHSDAIHMATLPEGNLIAAWVALDPVTEDNGPVFYYPGSHRWPYLYNENIGVKENWFLLDRNPNKKYEEAISRYIESQNIEPKVFRSSPGDVMLWHANLAHGGMPHLNKEKTRRSMVMHYFGKGVICYHELTQRPAILK